MSGSDGSGVTLSNADCFFVKLGHSETANGVTKLDTSTPQLSVLAGGQVDGPHLGIPALGGENHIIQRFALQVYSQFSAVSSMRFAMEHQNPLIAEQVTGGSAYPETSFSLLSNSDPSLILWALKPSEDGIKQGVVSRFWSLNEHPMDFTVKFAGGISKAWNDTHIEIDSSPASVTSGKLVSRAAPWQMRTFRLQPLAATK
jgi:alpha-mannosidase